MLWPALSLGVIVALEIEANADLPRAKLTSITPPGGKAGTTVDVVLAGSDLEGLKTLQFGKPGLAATLVEGTKFKIAIATDAPAGPVDVRAVGTWGVSNPRTFWVDHLAEANEAESNDLREQANAVAIGTVVNGILGGRADVDCFKFESKKGERVSIEVFGERLDSRINGVLAVYDSSGQRQALSLALVGKDPRLDFAAPADGTYAIELHDLTYEGGPEYYYRLAVSDRPRVDLVFPPVANPGSKAQVTLFGRNLPGGKLDPNVKIDGSPLESVSAVIDVPQAPSDALALERRVSPKQSGLIAFPHRLQTERGAALPAFVDLTKAPISSETEPNDSQETANVVSVPVEVAGLLSHPGDRDWFRFSATKGQVLSIEGISERAGSPADLAVVVRRVTSDLTKKEAPITAQDAAEYDDNPANAGRTKFYTASHDPLGNFTVPGNGDYLIEVRDRYGDVRGDARFSYRLRIAPAEPDYRLAVMPFEEDGPSSFVGFQGGAEVGHVFVVRSGGFSGEIKVEAEGLPQGVSMPPVFIAANQTEAPVVFLIDEKAPVGEGQFKLKGTAAGPGGAALVRFAQPAAISWSIGGNVPRPTRMAQSLPFAVRENAPYRLTAAPATVALGQGSLLTLDLSLARRWPEFTAALAEVTGFNLPANVANPKINIPEKGTEAQIHFTVPANVPPGNYTFFVAGKGQVPFNKDPKGNKANVAVQLASTPVNLTVLPRFAELTANPPAPTVKPGEKVDVKIAVKRQNTYKGPVDLALVLPRGVEGITAPAVVVPADKNEAVVAITADAKASPGDKPFVAIRGAAAVDGKRVTVDAVVTIKVAK